MNEHQQPKKQPRTQSNMKSSTSANSNSKSSKSKTGGATADAAALVSTPPATKQHSKERSSGNMQTVESSPDSDDDSSKESSNAPPGLTADDKERNLPGTTTPTVQQHDLSIGVAQSPQSTTTTPNKKKIIVSATMQNNYLYWNGFRGASEPNTRVVNCSIKNSTSRKDKKVFTVDMVRCDGKIVTQTIWEDTEGSTIPFFERFFK